MVRDRIVFGCQSTSLREKLITKDCTKDLTLSDVVDAARVDEIKRKQMKEMNNRATSSAAVDAVNRKGPQRANRVFNDDQGMIQCRYCATSHVRGRCQAFGQRCRKCNKKNHFERACLRGGARNMEVRAERLNELQPSQDEYDDVIVSSIVRELPSIHLVNINRERWYEQIRVEGKLINLKLDSGSDVNFIPLDIYKRMHLKTRSKPLLTFRAYGGSAYKPIAIVDLNFSYRDIRLKDEFWVTDVSQQPILGLTACVRLGLIQRCSPKIANIECDTIQDLILSNHRVFEGVGKYDKKCHLSIKPNAVPVQHPPRRIAQALREKLKTKLQEMEQGGIICKVDEPGDWVNHITIVEKPNGTIRVCLDPMELNAALRRDFYEIPTLDRLASSLCGMQFYTVLDLKEGFYHIELDQQSSDLCAFSSPFGIYKFLRLPFGLNVAAELFQKWNELYFGDIDGVVIYIDDILIVGRTKEEHDRRLNAVLTRAAQVNARFNPKKIQLRVEKVRYLGHMFSSQGMEPDPDRIKAITDIEQPQTLKALQRFLGTVNYLRKFLPKMSEVTQPLRELLQKDVLFKWMPVHTAAVNRLKEMITQSPVLSVFDHQKPIMVQADASKFGLGACLIQEGKPVAYCSRSLSSSEQNYAQVEKEFLAILFACEKFHHYIYGRAVRIQTDHKPLVALMQKPISKIHASRLQRIKMKLSRYNLHLEYVPGTFMHMADFLSRAYLISEEHASSLDDVVHTINVSERKLAEFQQATQNDHTLAYLVQLYREGWPKDKSKLPEEFRYYWKLKDNLYEDNGLLFFEDRIFVPKALQSEMLDLLHENHGGIVKTKKRAATIFFWPGLHQDIEDKITRCSVCQRFQKSNVKEPLIPHPIPERCFERVGCDFFEFGGKNFLLLADYFSKWIHVTETKGKSAKEVCETFRRAFAIFGIPRKIVCDNVPFNSAAVREFCKKWNTEIVNSSPNYPQSNGFSERCVQTIKTMMRKCEDAGVDFYYTLLVYNNTPAANLDVSPAEIAMGRKLRTKVPVAETTLKGVKDESIRPKLEKYQQIYKQHYDKTAREKEDFQDGEEVLTQDPTSKKWVRGQILRKLVEPRSYVVRTKTSNLRRNSKFIRHCK